MLWYVLGLALLVFALWLREFWKLWLPYAVAIRAVTRGRKDMARRLFERVIATPTLWNDRVRRDARFRLAWLLMERKEYEAAAELLQTNLKARLSPAVEANTRQRLAEALEGASRREEAETERARAGTLLAGAEEDAERFLSEGAMLNRQQKFTEAYTAFERGLERIPESNRRARAHTMTQLALAAFHMGKPEETVRWSEAALALEPQHTIHLLAHSSAGLGYASLGRLEEAETHRLHALELARKAGNKDQVAQYMTQLAEIQGRRGHLAEALQRCEAAKTLTIAQRRMVYVVQAECLKSWGRFEEALQTVEMARKAPGFPAPSAENRMQAAFCAEIAVLKAELGQPEEALAVNQQALAGVQNDAKLTTQYRANELWYLALLGRKEEALSQVDDVDTQLPQYARGTQLSGYTALGRAFFAVKEYTRSRDYWERYLALLPDPVMLPKAHYFLAECAWLLGEETQAEYGYRQAVSLGIETFYVRLAERRLAERFGAPFPKISSQGSVPSN